MNKYITLPEPCSAKWSKMGKVEGGRFCDTCTKKVHDFTGWNEQAIIETIEMSEEQICGRFDAKTLHIEPIRVPTYFNQFKLTAMIASAIIFIITSCKSKFGSSTYGGTPVLYKKCIADSIYICTHKDLITLDFKHKPNVNEARYKDRKPCIDSLIIIEKE